MDGASLSTSSCHTIEFDYSYWVLTVLSWVFPPPPPLFYELLCYIFVKGDI